MNLQIISIPSGAYDLDDRIQRMLQISMLEYEVIDCPIKEALNDQDSQYYLYFEYPGLRTAKGRKTIKLLAKVSPEGNNNKLMQLGRGKHIFDF